MRRQFNETDYGQRARSAQYRCCREHANPGVQLASEASGVLVTSLVLGLVDRNDRLVAKLHGYLYDNGILAARGYLDPKMLVIDDVCMRMLPEPPPAPAGEAE